MKINEKQSIFLMKEKEILKSGFLFYIWTVLLVLLSCLLFSCCSSGEQVAFRYRSAARKIDKLFVGACSKNNFSGCVQVCYNNSIIFNKSYGYSNREFGIPNIPETRFMIGSVTKQMTAASVLLLRDKGLLSLDDKLDRYFPYLPGAGSVSLRELLMHCAGISRESAEVSSISEIAKTATEQWFEVAPEFQTGIYKFYYENEDSFIMRKKKLSGRQLRELKYAFHCLGFNSDLPFLSVSDGVEYLLKQEKRFSTEAHKFSYSNYGYMILGAVIEKVGRIKYEDFITENFFVPLDMNETGFGYNKSATPLLAQGYYEYAENDFFNPFGQDVAVNMPDYVNTYIWPGSAGMVYSTTSDLIKWQCGLKNILSAESIDEMFRGSCVTGGRNSSRYGLGTYITLLKIKNTKKKMYWHDGVIYNFSNIIASFARDNLYIAILSDQMTGYDFYDWPQKIAEIVFSYGSGNGEDEEFSDNTDDIISNE